MGVVCGERESIAAGGVVDQAEHETPLGTHKHVSESKMVVEEH